MGSIMRSATRDITIALWEYVVLILFMVIVGIIFSRRKNIEIKQHPEFKFYLFGLYAKIMGGLAFTMIYMYHYKSGDVFSYFATAKVLANLAIQNPYNYIVALVSDNSRENYYSLFSPSSGYPINYIYADDRTYLLTKIVSPLALIAFHSFVITTALVSVIAYDAVWKLYRTLVGYYPSIKGKLAFAVLFFPSALFWGSGIVKDTFTFSGLCYYIYGMNRLFFVKDFGFRSAYYVVLGSLLMIMLKPYVFMMLFPASLFWIFYNRIQRIKSGLIRIFLLPFIGVALVAITFAVMNRMADKLGKFSLDRALDTIVIGQQDMKRSEQYGTNYFDLGDAAVSWEGVFSKFPQAVFAGLFRPTALEANNATMLLSALENAFLIFMVFRILMRGRVIHLMRLVLKNPLLQMMFVFSILYAFMVAITTPNFGAMVRFKIPLLPLFVSGMYIAEFILAKRKEAGPNGHFRFEDYTDGEPKAQPQRRSTFIRPKTYRGAVR